MASNISVAGVARKGDAFMVMRRVPGGHVGGLWEFPGGKSEPGETPQEALRREWLEETDLDIIVGNEIVRGSFQNKDKSFTLVAFEVDVPKTDLVPALVEHDDWMWADMSQLEKLPLVESDLIVLKALLQNSL
jgi:8-oxo-dGTP diphosphatase